MTPLCITKGKSYPFVLLKCKTQIKHNATLKRTSPQLIEMPSLALSPVAPVLFSRSEPAKSTK